MSKENKAFYTNRKSGFSMEWNAFLAISGASFVEPSPLFSVCDNLSNFQMLLPSAFKTSSSRIRPSPTSKMPKHIQMGTGFAAATSNGGTTTSSLLDSGVGSNDSQGR